MCSGSSVMVRIHNIQSRLLFLGYLGSLVNGLVGERTRSAHNSNATLNCSGSMARSLPNQQYIDLLSINFNQFNRLFLLSTEYTYKFVHFSSFSFELDRLKDIQGPFISISRMDIQYICIHKYTNLSVETCIL